MAGFDVRTFGGQHAVIHPLVPVIPNVAYLVNGSVVLHPGDRSRCRLRRSRRFCSRCTRLRSKISEVIDFAVAVRAPQIHQIHDALLERHRAFVRRGERESTGRRFYGCIYEYLSTGQVREL